MEFLLITFNRESNIPLCFITVHAFSFTQLTDMISFLLINNNIKWQLINLNKLIKEAINNFVLLAFLTFPMCTLIK